MTRYLPMALRYSASLRTVWIFAVWVTERPFFSDDMSPAASNTVKLTAAVLSSVPAALAASVVVSP